MEREVILEYKCMHVVFKYKCMHFYYFGAMAKRSRFSLTSACTFMRDDAVSTYKYIIMSVEVNFVGFFSVITLLLISM